MRALIWTGTGQVGLEERASRKPGKGEALVRVRAAGVCSTDLHVIEGKLGFTQPPKILGHEIAGVVEESPGADWVGRRVIVDPVLSCGACFYCRAHRKLLCPAGGEMGTTGGDAGYAEYVTVPIGNLYPLPEPLSFEAGALIEPLDCTLGAFLKADPRPGESVVIFGSGPAGLLFLQIARSLGCGPVLVVGRGEARLSLARRLGAAAAYSYQDPDLRDSLSRETGGEGPDLVVEASGTDLAVERALEWVRRGGRIVLYGISGAGRANIASDRIVMNDLTVVTGIGSPLLWTEALRLASSGKIDLGALVTHRLGLDRFPEAMAAARDGNRSVKVVLTP